MQIVYHLHELVKLLIVDMVVQGIDYIRWCCYKILSKYLEIIKVEPVLPNKACSTFYLI